MDKLDLFKKRRCEIVECYDTAFERIPEITVQKEIPQLDTVRHLYIIKLELELLKGTRREIFHALRGENVCCNVHYIPTYYFPYYKNIGYKKGICPVTEDLYERMITIPLYYGMTDEDVHSVIAAVKEIVEYYSKRR